MKIGSFPLILLVGLVLIPRTRLTFASKSNGLNSLYGFVVSIFNPEQDDDVLNNNNQVDSEEEKPFQDMGIPVVINTWNFEAGNVKGVWNYIKTITISWFIKCSFKL